jgi:hypothetical protein
MRVLVGILIALTFSDVRGVMAQPTAPLARIAPDLRLDATLEDFSPIGRLYVGPRKEIVVTQPQDRQLRWFDAKGKRIGIVGKPGRGPGEFQAIGESGWLADSLWVTDGALRRLVLIGPNARVVRTTPLPQRTTLTTGPGSSIPMMAFGPLGISTDGVMIGLGMTQEGRAQPRERVVSLATSGTARVLHVFPSLNDPRWMLEVDGEHHLIPFRVPPQVVGSWDGSRVATMTTDMTSPTGGVINVVVIRRNGDTLFARSYPFVGAPIPQKAIDSALARLANAPPPPEGKPAAGGGTRVVASMRTKLPAVYSPAQSIVLGLDNTVWIVMRATLEGRSTLVLNSRGDPIATVQLPPRTLLRQANARTLWTIQTDADGLGSVVRYSVTGIPCASLC